MYCKDSIAQKSARLARGRLERDFEGMRDNEGQHIEWSLVTSQQVHTLFCMLEIRFPSRMAEEWTWLIGIERRLVHDDIILEVGGACAHHSWGGSGLCTSFLRWEWLVHIILEVGVACVHHSWGGSGLCTSFLRWEGLVCILNKVSYEARHHDSRLCLDNLNNAGW